MFFKTNGGSIENFFIFFCLDFLRIYRIVITANKNYSHKKIKIMLQFQVWIGISDDEARVLSSGVWAPPGITSKTKDFFHIHGLLTKGILINRSGQEDKYDLQLSEWGTEYFTKVKNHMEKKRMISKLFF